MSGLLQTLIEEDFGYKKEGDNWGRSVRHSSLTVNESEQKWYWNSKGMGGNILDYLTKVRLLTFKHAKELLEGRKLIYGIPSAEYKEGDTKPYDKLVDMLWTLGKDNRDYWYSRKLTDETIDRNMLGFYEGWSLIPLYVGDKFVNFQCRRDEPSKSIRYWYKIPNFKPVLLNKDILNLVDTIYITEGTVDSILLNQEGLPSIASTGGSGYWDDAWYPLFYKVKKIFYIADNDKAGIHASRLVSEKLGENKVRIYMFRGQKEKYDTVDYFRDGGTAKEFKEKVQNESRYLFEIPELNFNNFNRKRKAVAKR